MPKTKDKFYEEPSVLKMILNAEEVPIGAKLTVQKYGDTKVLQIYSKHPLDRGSSILIELSDLNALIDVLSQYEQHIKNTN